MNLSTASPEATIEPEALAERIAAGDRMTVLDVRPAPGAEIEGPGLELRRIGATDVLADPVAVAHSLSGSVVVVCERGKTAVPVAAALREHGVDAAVLRGGARGWLGALRSLPIDLGMDGLRAFQVQRPGRGCLSYLLAAGGQAVVVDPAPHAEHYLELAGELGVTIGDVVDTHLHADHLSGARDLARRAGATLRLPAATLERGIDFADPVTPLADGALLDLGGVELRAIALPGHTTDMTGLVVGRRALLSGDSLFADGIARPDLQRGDERGAQAMARVLHATLHGQVLTLDPAVVLLPGHDHPGVRPAAVAPTLGEVRRRVAELSITDPDRFAETIVADLPPRPANYEAVIAVNAGRAPYDPDLEAGGNSCATRRAEA